MPHIFDWPRRIIFGVIGRIQTFIVLIYPAVFFFDTESAQGIVVFCALNLKCMTSRYGVLSEQWFSLLYLSRVAAVSWWKHTEIIFLYINDTYCSIAVVLRMQQ